MSDTEIPASVTHREVQEILRTFAASRWTGMRLEVRGITVTVGKHGPPAAGAATPPAAAAVPPVGSAATATPAAAREGPAALSVPPGASAPAGAIPASPGVPTSVDTAGLTAVPSPAVGAFWTAPAPGQPPFVEVGQRVAAGDQLAIVEVMKLMNPVLAPVGGEIVAVAATNADLVEYEQPLFWLRPDG